MTQERYANFLHDLSAVIDGLLAEHSDGTWPELVLLRNELRDLVGTMRNVPGQLIARERAIAFHCRRPDLPLSLHEAYYELSDALGADVASTWSRMKTFLNALALFVKESIPATQTRGLRFKSFGALVASAPQSSATDALKTLIEHGGADLEVEFITYRDKMIEHPGKLRSRGLHTGSSTRIIHNVAPGRGETAGDRLPGQILVHELPSGGRIVYFHIAPSVQPGPIRELPQSVGVVADPGHEHFSRRGSHYHIFSTPDVDGERLHESMLASEAFESRSPDLFDAMSAILSSTSDVIRATAALRVETTS